MRNNSEENASSSDIVLDALNSWLRAWLRSWIVLWSTLRHSLLLKIAWIADLEASINYNEDDVAELQKNLYDHRAQLDKCKKDLLYLEAYSKREKNVKIFAVPQATGNENASQPEDTKEIVHNFFEQEL